MTSQVQFYDFFKTNICTRAKQYIYYTHKEETRFDLNAWLSLDFLRRSNIQNHIKATRKKTWRTLPKLISKNQVVFLQGRHIYDNISLCQEFTCGFKSKRGSCRACISEDFTKALDTLRWDVISVALETMGYDRIFRKLVGACLSSSSFVASVDGSSTHIFSASRGIRHGDLLSPLLFIIVLEILSWCCKWRLMKAT